jgi:molybdopterin synthase sulfur carrier subunit
MIFNIYNDIKPRLLRINPRQPFYFAGDDKSRVTTLVFGFKIGSSREERIHMLVKVFANLRQICGGVTVVVQPDGDRVIDVLDKMVVMYPKLKDEIFTGEKELLPFVHVYVNGRNIIHLDNLQTKVEETDQFALFPPVAGG